MKALSVGLVDGSLVARDDIGNDLHLGGLNLHVPPSVSSYGSKLAVGVTIPPAQEKKPKRCRQLC